MSAEITAIHGGAITAEGTPAEVIEAIESMLEMAKRGEIVAIGMAAVDPAGAAFTSARWQRGRGLAMLGAVALLQTDVTGRLG